MHKQQRSLINPAIEAGQAIAIIRGNPAVWASTTYRVTKGIGSWKLNHAIDHEAIVLDAIWKAAQTYRPIKVKFKNWAILVAINMLRDAYKRLQVRSSISGYVIEDTVYLASHDHLDDMIAKEEADVLLSQGGDLGVMAKLLLLGKTRAQAARIMSITRQRAHILFTKLQEVKQCSFSR